MIRINLILIGLLLITFNYGIQIGPTEIGIIPDFLGYWLMFNGVASLEEKSPLFASARFSVFVTMIASVVVYVIRALGLHTVLGIVMWLVDFAMAALSIWVTHNIVISMADVEKRYKVSLVADIMNQAWGIRAAFVVMANVAVFVPMASGILNVIAVLTGLWFIIVFLQAKRLYVEKFGN